MDSAFFNTAKEGLTLILLLSLAPLLASLLTGLIVSLIQALTQVQEQTLTFVPKMVVTILILILLGGRILERLLIFMDQMFKLMSQVGTRF
jgi:flagellar biosynthesis protein FliQ